MRGLMEVIEFKGRKCSELQLTEWKDWVCKHLRKYVSAPNTEDETSITQILRGNNRSSEIFITVKGPLKTVTEKEGSPVLDREDHICCGQCWINVYASNNL